MSTVAAHLLVNVENALREGERLTVRARGAHVVAIIFDTEPAGRGLRAIVGGSTAPTVEHAVLGAFADAGRDLNM
jgi:hypothetical protein